MWKTKYKDEKIKKSFKWAVYVNLIKKIVEWQKENYCKFRYFLFSIALIILHICFIYKLINKISKTEIVSSGTICSSK